ncbi:hypothetical protein TA3x_000528 [Tundrisphaera sp. TA3]|uniref:hypothetical protein n=1 Tax=Tundrisphaera sp. TA3 TaxID=3435775 RepID=UPI003EBFA79C
MKPINPKDLVVGFKERIKGIVIGPWGRLYGSPIPVIPVPTIDSLLARANGRRRVRRLDSGDINRIVGRCRDAENGYWSYGHGGLVASSYGWWARSTYAFAAKIDGGVYLGITDLNAKTLGTPGAGWHELWNLTTSGPEKQAKKLRAWRDRNLNRTVVRVRMD